MDQELGLTIIENSIDVFRSGNGILLSHRDRALKAQKVGEDIKVNWEKVMALEDGEAKTAALAELDARSNKYLVNCNTAAAGMKENRKAITQLMDTVKSMFTEEKNKIDPKFSQLAKKIQEYRNYYAKWLLAEQDRIRKEAELKAAKGTEANELTAKWNTFISEWLVNYLVTKKARITESFNGITPGFFSEIFAPSP